MTIFVSQNALNNNQNSRFTYVENKKHEEAANQPNPIVSFWGRPEGEGDARQENHR